MNKLFFSPIFSDFSEGQLLAVTIISNRFPLCPSLEKPDTTEHSLIIKRIESIEKRVPQKAQTAGARRENGLRLFRKVILSSFHEFPADFRHPPGK